MRCSDGVIVVVAGGGGARGRRPSWGGGGIRSVQGLLVKYTILSRCQGVLVMASQECTYRISLSKECRRNSFDEIFLEYKRNKVNVYILKCLFCFTTMKTGQKQHNHFVC